MPPKQKYTDPKLRDEVKEDIKNSDKGGAPGQWSARKAQFMAAEYKKRGGSYNQDKSEQDSSQKNLSKWTEEEWQTKEGDGSAKKADGTQKRYLPKKAWEEMSEVEKEETDKKKQKGSKQGKQFVGNTKTAKEARKGAEADGDGGEEENGDEEQDAEEEEQEEEEEEKPKRGRKRKSEPQSNGSSSSKKQKPSDSKEDSKPQANSSKKKSSAPSSSSSAGKKTMGSKHDPATPPAKPASTTRLPKKGQQVTWKAMPGWVKGTVLEIAKKDGETEGKKYKASKEDPTIVLRAESGKVCAHKAKSVYFD